MADRVGIVFGTMTFGTRCDEGEAGEILKEVEKYTDELDTALMYGGGKTEVCLLSTRLKIRRLKIYSGYSWSARSQ